MESGARRRRQWRWCARVVVIAVLLVAAALVAFSAIRSGEIIRGDGYGATTSPSSTDTAAASATCAAWRSAKRTIDAASRLPAGWYWDTSDRKTDINNLAAAVGRDLDLFETQILATDPADVSAAAHSYVFAKRKELRALTARTFDNALASAVTSARADLNHVCDISDGGRVTV
jgi:hypothetical protein